MQITLETNDLNEEGVFSEEGKSFACMDCQFIFSSLKDVMTHLVQSCKSIRTDTPGRQHKIDVFKTDGTHSTLNVVKKAVVKASQVTHTKPFTVDKDLVSVLPMPDNTAFLLSSKDDSTTNPVQDVSFGLSREQQDNLRTQNILLTNRSMSIDEVKSQFDSDNTQGINAGGTSFTTSGESVSSSSRVTVGSYGNVVLEMVDPTVPLKRGRPKGSRNRPKDSSQQQGDCNSDGAGECAFVGSWKTPPVGSGAFGFSRAESQEAVFSPPDVQVMQLPVTEGQFAYYYPPPKGYIF